MPISCCRSLQKQVWTTLRGLKIADFTPKEPEKPVQKAKIIEIYNYNKERPRSEPPGQNRPSESVEINSSFDL